MSAVPKTELDPPSNEKKTVCWPTIGCAEARSELNQSKNPNNMQGQWVKVGGGANLGTVLEWQVDNELKSEG